MKSKQIGSSRYFTFVEFKETTANSPRRKDKVGNLKDYVNQPREQRNPYTFKTGAVY